MEKDEDLFSVLDGINQAAGHYGAADDSAYDAFPTQWPRQSRNQQHYEQRYQQQHAPSMAALGQHGPSTVGYGQHAPSMPAYGDQYECGRVGGEHEAPEYTTREREPTPSLFVSPHQLHAGTRMQMSPSGGRPPQFMYQTSSPQPPIASSPAWRASQRRQEYTTSPARITQPTPQARAQGPAEFRPPVTPQRQITQHVGHQEPQSDAPRPQRKAEVLSTHTLPDRVRSVFPYPNFNAMQSKCFPIVYQSSDNFVLSSPTGSGKTAIFELAICRVINSCPSGQFKIIYQAPTKSLCAERQRDWQQKFRNFQLDCAELTGDTDPAQMRNVQSASIIITTPEKWDSITRKWKDHAKLMSMIKLFLIDEVHMLHDARGATLEAVVSRMKSVHSEVRFIALSATVPNSSDIATWLGRSHDSQEIPAREERFGEEYRPVLLQKHVIGHQSHGNDFALEKMLDSKLPEVIAKYSHRKPIMIFCMTRKVCENTARLLARWWESKNTNEQYWRKPQRQVVLQDKGLASISKTGVAWHHAGLLIEDRVAIEKGFIEGNISVICCTSTLAVGVNLPCHMVILKNTVCYLTGEGVKEYTDLEVMQMLGRAGRPQYDTSAVAVILTRQEKVRRYERMVSGDQILESCLHEHLIDHLNAEIGLGTVTNLATAKRWLSSTFLYVRLQKNPSHYRLDDGTGQSNIDARLENICCRDIDQLREAQLIEGETKLDTTAYGDAMARYYVRFETAKLFLALPKGSSISEILTALAMANEWQDIRFRAAEKTSYKDLNASPQIRFPFKVNLDTSAHKVSLIIQSQLGAVNLPVTDQTQNNIFQYNTDTFLVFQHLRRLIRCIIDFKCTEGDSLTLCRALFMCRSIGARCWDDWSLVLKQIENIGPAGVLKLVNVGINNMEALENADAHRIETALKRNTPFGMQVINAARAFPKLRVSLTFAGKPEIKAGKCAKVKVDADIGFMNDKPVTTFNKAPVYVVLLAETTDGRCAHFARTSANKVGKGQRLRFVAELTSPEQAIRCHVMCDEIAGTCTSVSLKPTIPSIAWPKTQDAESARATGRSSTNAMNTSKRRQSVKGSKQEDLADYADEFGDDLLDESDLVAVMDSIEDGGFRDIDTFYAPAEAAERRIPTTQSKSGKFSARASEADIPWQPTRRADGKWDCNHKCGNKDTCRHYCCNHGLDKPPKRPKVTAPDGNEGEDQSANAQRKSSMQKGQMTLDMKRPAKRPMPSMEDDIDVMDLTQTSKKPKASHPKADDFKRLEKLHGATNNPALPPFLRPSLPPPQEQSASHHLSFLPSNLQEQEQEHESTDYGPGLSDFDLPTDPLNAPNRFEEDTAMVDSFVDTKPPQSRLADRTSTTYGYDEEVEEAMVGLADSHDLEHDLGQGRVGKAASTKSARKDDGGIGAAAKGASPVKTTGLKAPFFQSSSEDEITKDDMTEAAALQKHPSKQMADQTAGPIVRPPCTDGPVHKAASKKLKADSVVKDEGESSDQPSDVDPMILSMFGSYVDFV